MVTFKNLAIQIDLLDDGNPSDPEILAALEEKRGKETAFIARFGSSEKIGEAVRSVALTLRPV